MSDFTVGAIGGGIFCLVLAVAGGLLTRLSQWYFELRKPRWKPPDWSFGPIWFFVFVFLTLAIAYAWDAASGAQRTAMVATLAVNGVLNIAWSGIFFMMQNPRMAFIELIFFWLSILALVYVLGGISATAGLLLLPYLAWVSAAGLLNFQILRLNRL
jgi:translocator protein